MRLKPRRVVGNILTRLLKEERLIVLLGARQVGKTSIMQLLIDKLLNIEKVEKNKVFYFDLEDMSLLEIVNRGINEFTAFLKASGANLREGCFVFLDEIQYMENPSNFLKLLVDHHKEIKTVVSGSSSFAIRSKFKDSLAGRKVVFNIYPLDFGEFLEFRGRKDLADFWNTVNWGKARFFKDDFSRFFKEYVVLGGLPKVSLLQSKEEKIEYLKDVVNSYIKKDIKELFRIDNPYAFNKLLKLLSSFTAKTLNFSNLTSICGISRRTLERYLFILESAFIIKLISPFYTNRAKEVAKMPKLYFTDTGIRNIVMGDLNPLEARSDSGDLVENSVFSMLLMSKGLLDEIYYWRTKAGAEMDFVLRGETLRAYEIKYRSFKQPKISRSIRSFMNEYFPTIIYICTKDFYYCTKIDESNVFFLPVFFLSKEQLKVRP
ncbi:MAG: ATP-binding protein [Candidatus Aerophobetes bacterium]|nr:ATP-binding protein [Candidatus Aerophobetes bacterium]